jgi:hypothetical protein
MRQNRSGPDQSLIWARAASLNDSRELSRAQAEIVLEHMRQTRLLPPSDEAASMPFSPFYSPQYPLRCVGCGNANCRTILNPVTAADSVAAEGLIGGVHMS